VTYEILFFLGYLLLLGSFARLCVIVRRNRLKSRFWWELERCRACVAFEGDPGAWEEQK